MPNLQKFKRFFQKEEKSEYTAPDIGIKTGSDELLKLSQYLKYLVGNSRVGVWQFYSMDGLGALRRGRPLARNSCIRDEAESDTTFAGWDRSVCKRKRG